jgi:hypothetical protein
MSQVQSPKPKTLQKVMNTPINSTQMVPSKLQMQQKKWDQLDTLLAKYGQNNHQTLLLKISSGHVRPRTGYVWSRQIYPVNLPDMSGLAGNILLNFDS